MDDLFQQVVGKAERAVAQLSDQSDAALDYSESSLSAVEDMLAQASGFATQMPADQIDGLVRILGSLTSCTDRIGVAEPQKRVCQLNCVNSPS